MRNYLFKTGLLCLVFISLLSCQNSVKTETPSYEPFELDEVYPVLAEDTIGAYSPVTFEVTVDNTTRHYHLIPGTVLTESGSRKVALPATLLWDATIPLKPIYHEGKTYYLGRYIRPVFPGVRPNGRYYLQLTDSWEGRSRDKDYKIEKYRP